MGEAMSTLVFQPPPPSRLKQSKLVWLKNSYGTRIPAFHIQTPDAKLTFLYSHANAEDLGNVYPWCKFLAKMLKANVFAYDYTGYGLSEGTPSQDNCFADIYAAFKYIVDEIGVSPRNIVLYGRSLGTGPSCYLAVRSAQEGQSVGGLVLHAPFLSIYRIVVESGCTLMGDRFPNVDFAPFIRCPVLLIHGKKDTIVPFWHSEQLHMAVSENYRTKPLFIKDMGHNHVHALFRPLFVERLNAFLKNNVTRECHEDRRFGSVDTSDSVTTTTTRSSYMSSSYPRPLSSTDTYDEEDIKKINENNRTNRKISSVGLRKVFGKRKVQDMPQ